MQIYFYDADNELKNRLRKQINTPQGQRIMQKLQNMIKECSLFYNLLKQNLDILKEDPTKSLQIFGELKACKDFSGAFNVPQTDQIAAIVPVIPDIIDEEQSKFNFFLKYKR